MYLDYFYWHYVAAPRWLATFFWNIERLLFQFFSVRIMVRTLFAYWRRDRVVWRGGSLGNLALTVAWNFISRGIGLVIRVSVIFAWLITASFFVFWAVLGWLFFLLWPLVTLVAFAAGIALLLQLL